MDLHELERDEILSACGLAEMVRLKPGEFLFREEDEARCLYIVKRGTLRVMSGSTVFETLRAGAIVGEMAIIEAEMPRSATVIAGTHAELAAIDLDKFLKLVSNTPSFALTVMRVIARRLRVMNQRVRAGHAV
jgi:CRP/FNR family cyclic AMP-dependent transcriptional regulator